MATAEENLRDPWVDGLKTLAIVGVVWIHVARATGAISVWMRFSVPVFVVLWAYYFENGIAKRSGDQQKTYLVGRIRKLIIPYCVWSIFYAANSEALSQSLVGNFSLMTVVKLFGGKGWPGQYFLLVLLQLVPVLLVIRARITERMIWILLGTALLFYAVVEFVFWGFPGIAAIGHRPFVYWLPYALIGIGLARGCFKAIPRVLAAIIALVAIIVAPYESSWSKLNLQDHSPYIQVSVLLMSIGIMLAWPVHGSTIPQTLKVSQQRWFGRWGFPLLRQIGSNTFSIFVMNPMVMYWLPGALEADDMGAPEVLLRTTIVILICWILGGIFRRLRLGVLLGEYR